MQKFKIKFICQHCGYDSPKWLGRCPGCEEWNTFIEEVVNNKISKNSYLNKSNSKPISIVDVDISNLPRYKSGIIEFDRALGGGIVPGSLILVGGDPGIGKSTLLLQVALQICKNYGEVLYVSGEESAAQVRLRAERLENLTEKLLLFTETNLDNIIIESEKRKPNLIIIDSIQTMFNSEISSAPGSASQVRECTGKLLRLAKEKNISVIIIGHVTKDGNIAGPKMLEHMVDVVIYFEGERNYVFRVLRVIKNRFGSTFESGIFTMEENGLMEVKNASMALLTERAQNTPGSVILAYLEGIRPILIEIQALVSLSYFGIPRRTSAGFDFNRLTLIVAVLEKKIGMNLGNQDIYVNAVGGLKINEPAADLAVALVIASGFKNISIDPKTVVMGEVGLTGEIRMIPRADERIKEAKSLGFKRFVIPYGNKLKLKNYSEIEIIGVKNLTEAMEAVIV